MRVSVVAAALGAYALVPLEMERRLPEHVADIPSQFHAALSWILGWLLVFRTNVA